MNLKARLSELALHDAWAATIFGNVRSGMPYETALEVVVIALIEDRKYLFEEVLRHKRECVCRPLLPPVEG